MVLRLVWEVGLQTSQNVVLVSGLRAKACGPSKCAARAIVDLQALEACVVRPRNYSGLA